MNRVVVTGLGVIAPTGLNLKSFGDNLFAGKVAIGPVSFTRPQGQFSFTACPITGYRAEEHFDPKTIGLYDRFAQFAVIAAREAWRDAGKPMTPQLAPRVACVIGTGAGGQVTLEESYDRLHLKNGRLHPLTIPRLMANAGASLVSMELGTQGPAFSIASACASATHAIGVAMQMVRSGAVDMAVTGGSEACLTYGTLKGWEALRVMAPDACRPFSKDRQGMMLGEGGGVLVLERMDYALARGAEVYAELAGFGMSADAKDITTPDVEGMQRAMQSALQDAGLTPEDIDYINAHGTGTRANDVTETAALHRVFGARAAGGLPTSSSKSMFGHLLGGAGALETIATVLALKHQMAPPTMNYLAADPDCELDVVPNAARALPLRAVLKNSFAFGGLNAVLALVKV
jgi:nodulation protein E